MEAFEKLNAVGLDCCHVTIPDNHRWQGWPSGESTCLPPMWPGCGLSLLVLYSAMRGFSTGTPVFPSHQKATFDLI